MNLFLKATICFALFCLFSCKHEGISGTSLLIGQDCAFAVKYDAEVITTEEPVNAADMSRLTPEAKVGLMPHSRRNAVEFCMKENGSSEWLIEELKPRQVFEARSYTSPDPSPKAKTIKVVNDQATFIDAGGHTIKTESFKINEMTKSLNSMLHLAKNSSSTANISKMLEDARNANAEILDMGEGLFRITKSLPNSTDMVSILLDKNLERVISSATLDGLGKPIFFSTYTYEKGDAPILKTVVQRSFKTNPQGIEMKAEKMIEFIKLDIVGNIPNKGTSNTKN